MVFVVTMSSLGIVDKAEISSLVSLRFIKALTKRALATYCSVNTVLIYLIKYILVSRWNCAKYVFACNNVRDRCGFVYVFDVEIIVFYKKNEANIILKVLTHLFLVSIGINHVTIIYK